MSDLLLTLVMPADIAQQVEDLLLEHPELIAGFTTSAANGHGSAVHLVEPAELVSGHSPRIQIQTVGEVEKLRAALDLLRETLPRANVFYWLVPVLESGRIA
jgi:hypothetical protein